MLWTKCDKRYAEAITREGAAPACDVLDIMSSECRSLAHEPAACTTVENERCERARRARAGSPRLIERKNGHDRRGGSREQARRMGGQICAEQLPCAAGPCKPRGHMRIHAVKVQPPAALGDPYTPHFHPAAKIVAQDLLAVAGEWLFDRGAAGFLPKETYMTVRKLVGGFFV